MLRRFGPPIVCVVLAVLVLLARLWDIQVVQHEIWAREAANLVRSYGVDPYVRGSIRDRRGRLIVRDEERYALEFVWRDFRRGHPLGQVAMMRSLALGRPVGLDEARMQLVEAAFGYVEITPRDLRDFSMGEELEVRVDYVPAIAAEDEVERVELARDERRGARAGDLRFYVQRLLALGPRDVRAVDALVEDQGAKDVPYVELAARVTDRDVDQVRRDLRTRVLRADEQLVRLAGLIEWGDEAAPGSAQPGGRGLDVVASPGDRLVALIEERRRAVDDDTADALFRIAAGFSSTRLSSLNLGALDLEWLRAALHWDGARLDEWRASRGSAFEREVAAWGAGFAVARSKPRVSGAMLDPFLMQRARAAGGAADRVISACAHAFRAEADAQERMRSFGEPEDWRLVDRLAVLDPLAERLDRARAVPRSGQVGVFRFQDPELAMAGLEGPELLLSAFGEALEAAERRAYDRGEPITAYELAERLCEVATSTRRDWDREDEELYGALLLDMHRDLQTRVADVLDLVAESDPARGDRGWSGVAFDEGWLDRALDRLGYVVRDRGARPKRIGEEPGVDLVLLVTRYRDTFAGFRVRSTTRRIPIALGADGEQSIAPQLVGRVRSPFLVDVLRQRPRVEKLVALQRKLQLPEEDRRTILSLIDGIHQPGTTIGGSGIEAWFEKELAGTAGYREIHGLQDRVAGNRAPIYKGAVDGTDLTLTLDIDLQRAAESVLLDPSPPPSSDRRVDDHWFECPVGAIVLATVDGRILAAASGPQEPGPEVDPQHPLHDGYLFTDGQRAYVYERSLTRPWGQPPGSVVKPLLAAYALEHLGLDPTEEFVQCNRADPRPGTKPKKSPRAGYGAVDCNVSEGHSVRHGGTRLDLRESLKWSCNVYFAALAERRFDPLTMRDAYRTFGFGEPTGVRRGDDGTRSGLVDNYWHARASALHPSNDLSSVHEVTRQLLGNGLTHVDANVVQVARAYAGLATGSLPEMTLVAAIGDEELPRVARPLGIADEHLAFVRDALDSVVHEYTGTAYKADLREDDLGFRLAAKTGSADYGSGMVPPYEGRGAPLDEYVEGTRKHTWLAGWFPSAAPEYVVVVYLHDTAATASHSAVYVARQFLQRDEVRALVHGGGPR
ncbi:MAG: penicillin-binding transpeptidase domain-containing protein [Planctomycetota bacterium]